MLNTLTLGLLVLVQIQTAAEPRKPNIVILYIDDMGWGEPGCYGGKRAPTPHLDSLARDGIRFTDGYVSACVCSPSRVGLVTGRHPCRTGHDSLTTNRPGSELLKGEVTIAERLKPAGYATAIIGKWHLGQGAEYLPAARGFDYGFGSMDNLGDRQEPPDFYRMLQKIPAPPGSPVTTPLYVKETVDYIAAHRAAPFLLYVPFNAVHGPSVASERYLQRHADLKPPQQKYAAMIAELDDGIGAILQALTDNKLDDDTLVFCIGDNGGPGLADNGGLRGGKWELWEGGTRVPWLARWTKRIPAGKVVNEPVTQLDVLPTALAVAGIEARPDMKLDGVNLLPLLEGKAETLPRDALYWRFGVQFAVRQRDWKLVKAAKDMKPMLVNLKDDPAEKKDLTTAQPEKAKALLALWKKWDAANQPPRWTDRRWDGEEARKTQKKSKKA